MAFILQKAPASRNILISLLGLDFSFTLTYGNKGSSTKNVSSLRPGVIGNVKTPPGRAQGLWPAPKMHQSRGKVKENPTPVDSTASWELVAGRVQLKSLLGFSDSHGVVARSWVSQGQNLCS